MNFNRFRRFIPAVANAREGRKVMKKLAVALALGGSLLGLAACDPYDPGQRAVGGGLLGAGTGAAIGGLAGGNAGTGALIGGAVGAVGGAATTPRRY
jgi:hypothetical protein